MIFSPTRIVGSLVYRTREALNADKRFLNALERYDYTSNCMTGDSVNLWHFPGTHNEISRVLLDITDKDPIGGSRLKFPAVLDFLSIRQTMSNDQLGIALNLAFVAPTNSNWLTEQREVLVFDLLLRPMVDEFIRQVIKCGYFQMGYGTPDYTKYEVFTTGNNQGELVDRYGEYIDAIELHNLNLTIKSSLCDRQFAQIEMENDLVRV